MAFFPPKKLPENFRLFKAFHQWAQNLTIYDWKAYCGTDDLY